VSGRPTELPTPLSSTQANEVSNVESLTNLPTPGVCCGDGHLSNPSLQYFHFGTSSIEPLSLKTCLRSCKRLASFALARASGTPHSPVPPGRRNAFSRVVIVFIPVCETLPRKYSPRILNTQATRENTPACPLASVLRGEGQGENTYETRLWQLLPNGSHWAKSPLG
jgi:hypothetical protein